MKNILIIGAGRSSTGLVHYLNKVSQQFDYSITIADYTLENATEQAQNLPRFTPIQLDVRKEEQLQRIISKHDIVASLVPPHLHFPIADQCIKLKKPLITASYVSPEINALKTAPTASSPVANEAMIADVVERVARSE